MQEQNDNALEDFLFENILNNKELSGEVLKISDMIMSQNIDDDDKLLLHKCIIGTGIINEDEEIKNVLGDIRNENNEYYLLYKLVFQIIEEVCDVDDANHLNYLPSNHREALETDMIYFLRDVFEYIRLELQQILADKESFSEILSKDYMSDEEMQETQKELQVFFDQVWSKIQQGPELQKFKDQIHSTLEEQMKVLNIS